MVCVCVPHTIVVINEIPVQSRVFRELYQGPPTLRFNTLNEVERVCGEQLYHWKNHEEQKQGRKEASTSVERMRLSSEFESWI